MRRAVTALARLPGFVAAAPKLADWRRPRRRVGAGVGVGRRRKRSGGATELIPFDTPLIVIGPSYQAVTNIRAPRHAMQAVSQGFWYTTPGTCQASGGACLTPTGATENGNAANYYRNRLNFVLAQLWDPAIRRCMVFLDAGPNDCAQTGVTAQMMIDEAQYIIDAVTGAGHMITVAGICGSGGTSSGQGLANRNAYNAWVPTIENNAAGVYVCMTRVAAFDYLTMSYDTLHMTGDGAFVIGAADWGDLAPYCDTNALLYPTNLAPSAQLAATDVLTFSSNVTAGDTITLTGANGPVVVTWVASGATGMQVNRGGTNVTSAGNLNTFINANSVALGGLTSTVVTSVVTLNNRAAVSTVTGSGFPVVTRGLYHSFEGTGGAITGGSGSVADGVNIFVNSTGLSGGANAGLGLTVTASKTTDADGFPAQQLDITGTATNTGFWAIQTIARFLNQAGQYAQAWSKVSYGSTDGGAMAGMFSFGAQLGLLDGIMNRTRETNTGQLTTPRTVVMRGVPICGMVNASPSQTWEFAAGCVVSGQTYNLRIVVSRAGAQRVETIPYAAPFNLSAAFPGAVANNPLARRPALSGTISSSTTWTLQNPTCSGGGLVHTAFNVKDTLGGTKYSTSPGGTAMSVAGAGGDIGKTFFLEDVIADNGYGALTVNDGPQYAVAA